MARRDPPQSGTRRVTGIITLYQEPNGDCSLYGHSGSKVVRAELAEPYVIVQRSSGSPRILSTKPNERGMAISQAIARGVLRLRPDLSAETRAATLAGLKAARPRSRK